MEFNFIDPRRDSLQYNRSRGYNRWLMSGDVELGRKHELFFLLFLFLPLSCLRTFRGKWSFRLNFGRTRSRELGNLASNIIDIPSNIVYPCACPIISLIFFVRLSLSFFFFSFSCNWGERLHCQVSPPFLEAEVSLVFGWNWYRFI